MDYQSLLTKYNDEMQVRTTIYKPDHLKPYDPIWYTPITFKQNHLQWLRGEKPVFAPMPTHGLDFAPYCIPDVVARHYIREVTPYNSPDDLYGNDMFGIEWEYVPSAMGSMVKPGNPAVEDLEDWRDVIKLPDVDSWPWEEDGKLNECMKQDEFSRKFWFFTGYFERLISWLDFENAAIAMIDEDYEDDVHDALDAITSTYEKIFPKCKQYFDPDIMYVHDDWGSQAQPFFSLDACMDNLEPYLERMVKCTHDNGMLYEMHCCGHADALVPAMIAAGVDTWDGQPMNDFGMVFDKWGDQIRVQAKIDVPTDDMSEQEVARFCEEFLDRYSTDSKWAAPSFRPIPNMHKMFYPLMYAISREYYATH